MAEYIEKEAFIEGVLMALDSEKASIGYDALEILDATIDEIWEEEHGKPVSDA